LRANAANLPLMNLETASQHIKVCRDRMDVLYQKPVFDEWIVLSLVQGKAEIRAYNGPRAEKFKSDLHRDSAPLMSQMQGNYYGIGDFEFVDNAGGSRYDACIRLGHTTYLLCNNTYGTLAALRQDVRWLEAQKPFVALTEKFRADPLV
jgi:hypothetical protein